MNTQGFYEHLVCLDDINDPKLVIDPTPYYSGRRNFTHEADAAQLARQLNKILPSHLKARVAHFFVI